MRLIRFVCNHILYNVLDTQLERSNTDLLCHACLSTILKINYGRHPNLRMVVSC